MSTTISDGTTTITLTDDLYWSDEFSWSPVKQTMDQSLTGAQIIQVGTLQSGRPITLGPADEASGWITYAALTQLRTWAAVPGLELTLTYRLAAHNVMFRHHEGAVLDVDPVVFFSDRLGTDWVKATMRFMEAE